MTGTGTIRADGATLYHERRGSGPALLMISGGGGGRAVADGRAEPSARYEPDYAALATGEVPVVIGGGATSRPYRPAGQ